MTTAITEDNLKSFSAAAASSGAVGLFHVIGVTPEAPDIETCFRNGKPKDTVVITPEMIVSAESRLIQGTCSVPDLITLGCPHYSVEEFKTLEKYLDSRKIKSGIRCKNFYGWMRVTISEKELGFYMCHVGLR
jgi:predicted aconitase